MGTDMDRDTMSIIEMKARADLWAAITFLVRQLSELVAKKAAEEGA